MRIFGMILTFLGFFFGLGAFWTRKYEAFFIQLLISPFLLYLGLKLMVS